MEHLKRTDDTRPCDAGAKADADETIAARMRVIMRAMVKCKIFFEIWLQVEKSGPFPEFQVKKSQHPTAVNNTHK